MDPDVFVRRLLCTVAGVRELLARIHLHTRPDR
jgi:hypothetical protein